MLISRTVLVIIGVLQFSGVAAADESSSDGVVREIHHLQCRDLMLTSGSDRDVTLAFLQGYALGKAGVSSADSEKLTLASKMLLERCVDAPASSALDSLDAVNKTLAANADP